jgi:hypothetical protein
MMRNETAKIVVHPRTRDGYAAERLRKAAVMDDSERQKFLEQALEKYRAWSLNLGALPHKISADVAILRCEFFPEPQKRRA